MKKEIIVYTMNDCVECTFVKKVLAEKGLTFEERNVSLNETFQKEVEEYGYLGVPVTVIGEHAVKGLNQELMNLIESIS